MSITSILAGAGPIALGLVALMVLIENGLLFPFLPGDSLVFAASLLAPRMHVHWTIVSAVAAVAAILGAEIGYELGSRYGARLFHPEARILKQRYLDEATRFFEKHGTPAVLIARFVPVVRTYIAPAAGIARMRRRTFTIVNVVGAFVWAFGLGFLGTLLGQVAWVAGNIDIISVAVVLVSVLPIAIGALHRARTRSRTPVPDAGTGADAAESDAERQ